MKKYTGIGVIVFISSIGIAQSIDDTEFIVPPYVVPLITIDTVETSHIHQYNALLVDSENGLFVADVNAIEHGDAAAVYVANDFYPVAIREDEWIDREANIALVQIISDPMPSLPPAAPLADESPYPSDSTIVVVIGYVGEPRIEQNSTLVLSAEVLLIPCLVRTVYMNRSGLAYMKLSSDHRLRDTRLSGGAVVLPSDGDVVGLYDVNYGVPEKALPIYKVKDLLEYVQSLLPIYIRLDQYEHEGER
ncbi:hypothetical protein MYX06_04605 [Patescibacteria group bacterium AH-259-L05]|nr:hypothetical protein [Patescibacteria group bacterium AH-259-L05]